MSTVLDHYIELDYPERPYSTNGKVVTLCRSGQPHIWTTITWESEREDPDGMHADNGGWTILAAPPDADIRYDGVAALMVQGGVAGCSTHLMPYHARALLPGEVDGVDNITEHRQACEVFVGANETHVSAGVTTYSNTHLVLPFQGLLPAGQKLRLAADYWNAPAGSVPLRMCSARVSAFWGFSPS